VRAFRRNARQERPQGLLIHATADAQAAPVLEYQFNAGLSCPGILADQGEAGCVPVAALLPGGS